LTTLPVAVTEPRAELRTFGGSLSRQASKSYKKCFVFVGVSLLLVVGWLFGWLFVVGNWKSCPR